MKVRVRIWKTEGYMLTHGVDASLTFLHEERTLPNCALSLGYPFYREWMRLDEKLEQVGRDAKDRIDLQLNPQREIFKSAPWFLGAFQMPIVYALRPRHPIVHNVMDLDESDCQFRDFLRQQDRASIPTSNALHCEQHFVSRALFIAADKLRTAVAFSNLDDMKTIRSVMCNLMESLDILIEEEASQREMVMREVDDDSEGE